MSPQTLTKFHALCFLIMMLTKFVVVEEYFKITYDEMFLLMNFFSSFAQLAGIKGIGMDSLVETMLQTDTSYSLQM